MLESKQLDARAKQRESGRGPGEGGLGCTRNESVLRKKNLPEVTRKEKLGGGDKKQKQNNLKHNNYQDVNILLCLLSRHML